jgi:predicted ArsR family transcriptional regulator
MTVKIVDVVKPIILQTLQTPLSVDKLAKELGVRKIQLQDWLAPLLADGILVEKTKGKAKVIAVRTQDDELSLN